MNTQFKPTGRKSRIIWRKLDWLPYHIGFCPDEAAWDADMKRLGLPSDEYPTSDGECTPLINDGTAGGACSIITVSHKDRPPRGQISLLTHEAVHAFQQLCSCIGEKEPSKEFEAYAIQCITVFLIEAYELTRGPLLLGSQIVSPEPQ